MSRLAKQLEEDRALRDSALWLLKSDLSLVREDLRERSLGGRIADRVRDGALDVADDAVDYANDNRGKLAAIVAGLLLWFARQPIIAAVDELLSKED